MFKALKEKVSNEYEKAKVNIQSQALNLVNNGTITTLTNTIGENKNDSLKGGEKSEHPTSNESSKGTKEPDNQYSEPGFSLVDLDDESISTKPTNTSSTSKLHSSSDNDTFFRTNFLSNMVSNFVPQSDIESEYESEASHRNLDNVNKEQLIDLCYRLKERGKKYRERWSEVVKAYRTTIDERDKLKNVLTETQDRALRRVNELKEQCNLEQEAKRHLEENLQVVIEEKEEKIKVLETKIELINNQNKTSDLINLNVKEEEKVEQTKMIENLEILLSKCNESLTSYKQKVDVLSKENESLLSYKSQSERLEAEIESTKKLKDSASASFSEAKQKLHDELESRSIIIKELKDQIEKRSNDLKHKNNELKSKNEAIKSLNEKASKLESNFASEKAALIEQLNQDKAAAMNLLRDDHVKQMQTTVESLENQIKTLCTEKEELVKEKSVGDSLKAQIVKFEQQIVRMESEKKRLEVQFEQACKKLSKTEVQLNECNATHEQELKSFYSKYAEQENSLKDCRTKIDSLIASQAEFEALKEKLNLAEKQLADVESEQQETRLQSDSIREKLRNKEEQFENMLNNAKLTETSLNEQLEQYRHRVEQQKLPNDEQILELESKIETLKEKNRQKIAKISELEKSVVCKDTEIIELTKSKNDLKNEIEALSEQISKYSNQDDEATRQLKADLEMSEKANEVTRKLINKLKEENSSSLQEINRLKQQNQEFGDEKTRLIQELDDMNCELVAFKNKLIDTFYAEYAERENSEISSLNYDDFLVRIEESYKNVISENQTLTQKIGNLEKLLQDSNESSGENLSKQNQHIKQLESTNISLIEEIEKLRNVSSQNKNMENVIEEKNVEISALNEKIESVCGEIEEIRSLLNQANIRVKELNADVSVKEETLKQKIDQLNTKERELAHLTERLENDKREMQHYEELKNRNEQLDRELKQSSNNLSKLSRQLEENTRQNTNYVDEINKIKSNAKEILESKHVLQGKLKATEAKIGELISGNQTLVDSNNCLQEQIDKLTVRLKEHNEEKLDLERTIERLRTLAIEKENNESQLKMRLKELENNLKSSSSDLDRISELEAKLRCGSDKCIDLENKLKARDDRDQEFKTEIIALEEKLKLSNRSEKELREDLQISGEVNNSLKEQIHKYLSDINELKNELEAIKSKHEQTVDKLYKQLEVRESQLDESLMNASSQYNSTAQELIKSRSDLTRLSKLVDELTASNRDLEEKLLTASESHEKAQQKFIEQYELRIENLQSKLDEQKVEIAEKMDQIDNIENRLVSEHKSLITQMENEMSEKNTALEEVHEYYQQRLKTKDNELRHLHEQLTSNDKNNYQINALQNSILQYHEENSRLKELINMRQEKNGDAKSGSNSDLENCAILGVHLPQPTEYEYLRNILFQFMTGREPVTLAKVIAAVMRFSNEQTDQIIRKQESLQHPKFNKPS